MIHIRNIRQSGELPLETESEIDNEIVPYQHVTHAYCDRDWE